ncbi:hypothetical protein JOC86_003587 [Bacillus pakistanensis]|uniref:Uncharacterized protein n=1 Tax=Rossellomorea pakistanensis TaxID=992288 RepID=A0ABS2NGV1_9BACI|nr:hypothetical protein [Bacillus pakistanensis]MBM7587035.1 hypothetical protein [Bacillus pakistanensis]
MNKFWNIRKSENASEAGLFPISKEILEFIDRVVRNVEMSSKGEEV